MPRFLAVGHVTWDRAPGGDVLGGAVSYAALAAARLGWEAAVATCAGPEFDPGQALPGIRCFLDRGPVTTRFANTYDDGGERRQVLECRAPDVSPAVVPDEWRSPDVLLLAPVAGEVPPGTALGLAASVVGAAAQGWLRAFDPSGVVSAAGWSQPGRDLAGVHVVFLSEHDLVPGLPASALLQYAPVVAVTRGWEGVRLVTREAVHEVPSLPRPEVDPTGAGDVFAAAFLLRYHETDDPLAAAAFAACAASCVVEGLGASTLGDRREVERRLALRERLIEEGDWDE